MFYFAYGTNLDPAQMAARCPAHREVGRASLADHRVHFPLYSENWKGGAASVALAHGHTVWGYVYELSEEDLVALDRREGWHGPGDERNRYERESANVELDRPDDGSIPRRVKAWIYVGRPNQPTLPSRRYLETLLTGARHRGLPEEYVTELEQTETGESPEAG